MAKAASPIRLQQELMQSATLAATLAHRSAAEQVEYWAFLGRSIAKTLAGSRYFCESLFWASQPKQAAKT